MVMKKKLKTVKEVENALNDLFLNPHYGYKSIPKDLKKRIKENIQKRKLENKDNVVSIKKFFSFSYLKFTAPVALAASFAFGIMLSPTVIDLYDTKDNKILTRGAKDDSFSSSKNIIPIKYQEEFETKISSILINLNKGEEEILELDRDFSLNIKCENILYTKDNLKIKILKINNNKNSTLVFAFENKDGEYKITYLR